MNSCILSYRRTLGNSWESFTSKFFKVIQVLPDCFTSYRQNNNSSWKNFIAILVFHFKFSSYESYHPPNSFSASIHSVDPLRSGETLTTCRKIVINVSDCYVLNFKTLRCTNGRKFAAIVLVRVFTIIFITAAQRTLILVLNSMDVVPARSPGR